MSFTFEISSANFIFVAYKLSCDLETAKRTLDILTLLLRVILTGMEFKCNHLVSVTAFFKQIISFIILPRILIGLIPNLIDNLFTLDR